MVFGIVALITLAVYYLVRLASKSMAKAISHFTLIQEKKSVSRLLPLDSGPVLKEIKNQEQLAQLMKSITVRNGWKNEDLASIPVWLLTGHIVVDANPNLLIDLSKRSAD